MKDFKAAAVTMDIKDGKKEENLENAEMHIGLAAKEGAELVCLPEYLLTGSNMEILEKLSEPVPGISTEQMGKMAREHGVYLAFSMPEKTTDGVYNTAVLVGPTGDVLGAHRKMHLFLDEATVANRGGDCVVVDTPLGKMGLMVCYDAVFPELSRNLALMGAEVLLVPANWPDPFIPQWDLATRARALDNQIWLVGSNRLGSSNGFAYSGGSRIVDPYGIVRAESKTDGVALALLEQNSSKDFRGIVDFLRDRKEEYGL
ncbi:MAG: carbon-nitrogen hydrolase family protein [Candidatus Thermoplasmatota archaeon]|nr:carbon-nitrogen hydrolase family protein [Candidatus Thermoplasmatota archaeon]